MTTFRGRLWYLLLAAIFLLSACSGSSSSSDSSSLSPGSDQPVSQPQPTQNTPKKVLASNVVLVAPTVTAHQYANNANSNKKSFWEKLIAKLNLFGFFAVTANADDIDTTTKILASNVTLAAGANDLTSTNLQGALDTEMRVDLGKILPNTTWKVTNKTGDPWFKDTTAEITFSSDGQSITLNSGRLGLIGVQRVGDHDPLCVTNVPNLQYELLSSSVMYTIHSQAGSNVLTAVSVTTNRIIFTGTAGGCGQHLPGALILEKKI